MRNGGVSRPWLLSLLALLMTMVTNLAARTTMRTSYMARVVARRTLPPCFTALSSTGPRHVCRRPLMMMAGAPTSPELVLAVQAVRKAAIMAKGLQATLKQVHNPLDTMGRNPTSV